MPPCDVPGCPSLAPPGSTKCPPHQRGVLASSVAATGRRCPTCKRPLAGDDTVTRVEVPAKHENAPVVYGYAHLACPPSHPRRALKGEPLPFDAPAERTDR